MTFKNSDVGHPFSGVISDTDTYAAFSKQSSTAGGLRIRSFVEGGNAAFAVLAYRETASSGDTAGAVIDLNAYKSDGGTGDASMGNGENMVAFRNAGTTKALVKGNGKFVSQDGIHCQGGQIRPHSYTVATLPTGEVGGMIHVSDETGGAQNAYYDGSNWKRMSDGATVS